MKYNLIPKIIYFLLLCTLPRMVVGANRTSTQDGAWNLTATWGGLSVPVAGDVVTINHVVTITAAAACASVTINATKALILNGVVFTVTGVWTNNGTFTPNAGGTVTFGLGTPSIADGSGLENFSNVSVASGSVLAINTGANVTASGTFAFVSAGTSNSVTLNGTAALTVTGAFTMPNPSNNRSSTLAVGTGTFTANGSFTMSGTSATRSSTLTIGTSGTANFSAITTTTTAGSIITVTGSGTINISGATSGTPNLTPGTGTVNFTGASQAIWLETYYNLGVSGTGTKTLNGNITVSNVLDVASSTLNLGTRTVTLPGTGTPLLVGGTLTPGTSTVIFSGTGAQTVAGTTYNNLTFSGAGTKTFADATSATAAGAFVIGSTTVFSGSAGIDVTGAISGSGSLTMGSGTFILGGANSHTGTFTAGTSKFHYDGAATQAVRIVNYYDLEFSLAGTKTIADATTLVVANDWIVGSPTTLTLTANANVAGNISGSGNITMGSGTILLEGEWTNNGTLTPGTGTIHYDSSGDQTVAVLPYYRLQTSVGGTKNLAGNITVTNLLTVSSPSILNLGSNTIFLSFTGTPLVITGTISGTGTVNFSGGGAQTITGTTYPNLEFSGAGTKTISAGATITVTTNWVVGSTTTMTTTAIADVGGNISGSGNITMGSGTINIAGDWTNNGTFTRGTGTVIYDGTTQSIGAVTYNNLQTSNSGVKTLAGNTSVANVLTINASTTLDLSSLTLTLSGSGTPLVNNGTFTCSTSTVNFSNAGSTNIPALNYYNLNLTGGPRVLANSGTIGIANAFTTGAGGFTVTGSTVNFNGSGAQTIPAFTFNDLVLSGSGAKTILTATSVTVNAIDINDTSELDLPGTSVINITKP